MKIRYWSLWGAILVTGYMTFFYLVNYSISGYLGEYSPVMAMFIGVAVFYPSSLFLYDKLSQTSEEVKG